MPKDDKDDKDEKPWTPDQALEDEEQEDRAQQTARARARVDHLYKQMTTPPDPKKGNKKKFNPFGEQ